MQLLSLIVLAGAVAATPVRRSLYSGLYNTTCVTAGEVAKDANWLPNAPVTAQITGGQAGVSLILDIGLMDTATCEALPNTLVEVWAPNAVGTYGARFLRGATLTGSNGIAEFEMIFPGFTSAGANHVNVIVHRPGVTSPANATTVAHVGQVFFTDQWTNVIGMSAPYSGDTQARVLNAGDGRFAQANAGGFSPIVDIEEIHDDWPEGISGYITIGVDPQAEYANA